MLTLEQFHIISESDAYGAGFVAKCAEVPSLILYAPTEEEAVAKVRRRITAKLEDIERYRADQSLQSDNDEIPALEQWNPPTIGQEISSLASVYSLDSSALAARSGIPYDHLEAVLRGDELLTELDALLLSFVLKPLLPSAFLSMQRVSRSWHARHPGCLPGESKEEYEERIRA